MPIEIVTEEQKEETGDPAAPQRFAIEFPEEIAPSAEPTGSDAATATVTAEPAAAETAEPGKKPEAAPAREKVVPLKALQKEREARKAATSLYERAEAARKSAEAESLRLRQEAEARSRESRQRIDFNALPDLNEAFSKHREVILEEVRAETQHILSAANKSKIALSERLMRTQVEDYDQVIERAGVLESIAPDPATGRPRDPFLASLIVGSDDPAAVAYEYARGKLADQLTAEAEQRGEQRGRQEVVEKVVQIAARPKGVSGLTNSSAARTGGFTYGDIDRMTHEQKAHVKKKYPDLWNAYLEAVPLPPGMR